jgi:starch-binding outer membrane protein, SusD/RagB family
MKTTIKTLTVLAAIATLILVQSCKDDFLDQVPDDKITMEDVFKRRADTEKYLANIYGYIRSDNDWNTSGSPWEGLSDEIDVTYNDYPTYSMNLGNWDKNRGDYNYWDHYYKGIRSATYFLQRADENKEIDPELLAKYKAEARMLRAWFYFFLMRQYGPVVIVPETPIAPDATIEEMSLARSPFDECISYVESEIDKAIADLPETPVDIPNWGRFNRGMARALKSRMLLYAASPLFNGNTDYAEFKNTDGTQLISQAEDNNKWQKAADAAKAVIDMPNYRLYKEFDNGGNIKAYESLKNVFLKDWNEEIIMARVNNTMYAVDKNGSPYKVGGWSSWGPTQQAVDAYFTANGRSIDDPASGYSESGFSAGATNYYDAGTYNMYVNREPRFYVAVTFNGSKWINNAFGTGGQPLTIQMFNGGNSGKYNGRNWSRTGYCVRKFVHPNSTVNPEVIQQRTEVLFRLGEIYLNYAEALNEVDPGNTDILKYLNLIRERAGIPQYGQGDLSIPATQSEMRDAIRRERRVELAFETHRYFDTRRWKIAEQTDGGPFYGMNIEATNSTDFSKRTVFETRVFDKKYYLWNIIQSELNKDQKLVGNPGW